MLDSNLSCRCGATATFNGPDAYVSSEVKYWRADHADCSKLATSPASSAPTTGPATKQSPSYTAQLRDVSMANPADALTLIQQVITACSKLTPSTPVELTAFSPDSSTLQLTLRWPTSSGSNEAGNPGPAVREEA